MRGLDIQAVGSKIYLHHRPCYGGHHVWQGFTKIGIRPKIVAKQGVVPLFCSGVVALRERDGGACLVHCLYDEQSDPCGDQSDDNGDYCANEKTIEMKLVTLVPRHALCAGEDDKFWLDFDEEQPVED